MPWIVTLATGTVQTGSYYAGTTLQWRVVPRNLVDTLGGERFRAQSESHALDFMAAVQQRLARASPHVAAAASRPSADLIFARIEWNICAHRFSDVNSIERAIAAAIRESRAAIRSAFLDEAEHDLALLSADKQLARALRARAGVAKLTAKGWLHPHV